MRFTRAVLLDADPCVNAASLLPSIVIAGGAAPVIGADFRTNCAECGSN